MSVAGKNLLDYPLLMSEWDYSKNIGLDPGNVSAGSNKKVWWRCKDGHEFFKSPNGRTNNHRFSDKTALCPQCYRESITSWTWDKIVSEAKGIVEKEGYLPPAGHLQVNGHASLIQAVYRNGKTWVDLREASGSFDTSNFVPSRSGLRWLSHAEASLSNFLFARGIFHAKGRKYPENYSEHSGKTYGYFDLIFSDKHGSAVDVEIWGDKPKGHQEEEYARVRAGKELFNAGRRNFLGIHFKDCYNDGRLMEILEPYIGIVEPHVFVKLYDPFIETTHWSNADELLDSCRKIANEQPDGKFPPEDWLRKRGKWANREGIAYNTLAVYIKLWIGGVRRVRELLGQSGNSTIKWNKETALTELKLWHEKYGKSPSAMRADVDRRKYYIDPSEMKRGIRIAAAIEKHAGGMIQACLALGIKPSRRYEKIDE